MFDNLTHNANSDLIVQEDPGNQPYLARVWHYDTSDDNLVPIAQHNPALFDPAYAGADKNFLTQDEESSGVIDLSSILGPGHYLADVQAHDPINAANPRGFTNPDELVEGGQLLVINTDAPGATLAGGVLTVEGTVNDDRIAINRRGSAIDVSFNGTSIGTFDHKGVSAVSVLGNAGDDVLSVGRNVPPVFFDGGAGDDTFLGRRRGDELVND